MNGLVGRIKDWWAGAEPSHRVIGIVVASLLAITAIAVVFFATRPHMSLLYSSLPANEQGTVIAELEKNGIKAEANERGDVMVPAEKIAEARMKLAVANKLPASGGFADYDKEISNIGLMNTPPVERERLKGILEQRIAESIQSIEGITAAQVHIVLGEDRAFISEAKPATASITISQAPGAQITKDQGKAIATLTANSVPGLTLANVAVLNNRMEMLFDGHDIDSPTGNSNQRFAAEEMESRKRQDSLQRRLDQVYGPNAVLVSIHAEIDFNQVTSVSDKTEPTGAVPVEKRVEEMSGKQAKPGGAAGTAANTLPGAPAANTNAAADSNYKNSSTTMAVGSETTHTQKVDAPGSIKSMAINIIANSDKITDQDSLNSIIDGELGPKAADQNFTRKVTMVKFDTSAAKAAKDAEAAAAASARMQQIMSMVPMIALILVGFFVLRQVMKIAKPSPVVAEAPALEGDLANALPASISEPDELTGMEITPEALMQANGGVMPEGVSVNPETGMVVFDGTEQLAAEDRIKIVRGISAKVNVPLEQLKKMCQDRPEAVAMLIKGWLLEESRR